MRPGPATRAASFVDLSSCLLAARSVEPTCTGPTALARSATFTSTGCASVIPENQFRATPALVRQPNPLKEREVEEAAMPGQPARARAHFRMSSGNSPSRIASCHQRHRNHRSTSVERSNVFALSTLVENVLSRNRKPVRPCAETVDDETSLWKPEEK